jgi:hypothetical protein
VAVVPGGRGEWGVVGVREQSTAMADSRQALAYLNAALPPVRCPVRPQIIDTGPRDLLEHELGDGHHGTD